MVRYEEEMVFLIEPSGIKSIKRLKIGNGIVELQRKSQRKCLRTTWEEKSFFNPKKSPTKS